MVFIESTRMKLREAQFFFKQLAYTKQQVFAGDPEEFGYFLSAFLSAARSVTFALQFEEKEKYETWFPRWLSSLTDAERELLRHFNEQRVSTVHRAGAEVSQSSEPTPMTEIRTGGPGQPAYLFFWPGVPGTPQPRFDRRVHSFHLGGTDSEVVETCRQYVTLLDRLVQNFGNSFG